MNAPVMIERGVSLVEREAMLIEEPIEVDETYLIDLNANDLDGFQIDEAIFQARLDELFPG